MIIYEYSDLIFYIAFDPINGPFVRYDRNFATNEVMFVETFTPPKNVVEATKLPRHFTQYVLKYIFSDKTHSAKEALFNIIKYGK